MSPTLNAVYWGKNLFIIFNIYFIIIFTFYMSNIHELLAQILKRTDHTCKMSICKKYTQPEQVRKKFTTAKGKKGEKGEQKTFKLKRHYPTPLNFLMVCHLNDNQLISTININKLID